MWGRYEPLLGFWGKSQLPNVFLDIIWAYVSVTVYLEYMLGGKLLLFFLSYAQKVGGTVPPSPKSGGTRTPVNYAYDDGSVVSCVTSDDKRFTQLHWVQGYGHE